MGGRERENARSVKEKIGMSGKKMVKFKIWIQKIEEIKESLL